MTAGMLDGKVVWITGAGKGLGRAIAVAVAGAGAVVAATSRTTADLDDLMSEAGSGAAIEAHVGSVADQAEVVAIRDRILFTHGRIDGLVNCAGISPSFVRSEAVGDDVFRDVFEVNVLGTFRCCREVAAPMLARRSGSIVNISSVHARAGFERIAPYTASKGAIEAMTRGLAAEWADRGVRVNSLAPGYFRTDLSGGLLDSSWGERIRGRVPMGRTGEASELAGAALYLLSDLASYTTGSTVTVDGGWTAW